MGQQLCHVRVGHVHSGVTHEEELRLAGREPIFPQRLRRNNGLCSHPVSSSQNAWGGGGFWSKHRGAAPLMKRNSTIAVFLVSERHRTSQVLLWQGCSKKTPKFEFHSKLCPPENPRLGGLGWRTLVQRSMPWSVFL